MPVYAYNSAAVQTLIGTIDTEIRNVEAERDEIVKQIGNIKNNWRDDATRLAQRDKDLQTLVDNAEVIIANMNTIKGVIVNQSTQYQKLNY